ncbi:hypothetical protein D1007_15632 [Hordeum vulgare]|nr:hypothetical protein D1007_15632 [Hordeum vulgare]
MPPRSRRFHFEPVSLLQPGFMEFMRDRWVDVMVSPPRAYCATDIWHHYSKLILQFMRAWGANLGAHTRVRKQALLVQIKALDEVADSARLSADDWLRHYTLEAWLMEIFKGGELFWKF